MGRSSPQWVLQFSLYNHTNPCRHCWVMYGAPSVSARIPRSRKFVKPSPCSFYVIFKITLHFSIYIFNIPISLWQHSSISDNELAIPLSIAIPCLSIVYCYFIQSYFHISGNYSTEPKWDIFLTFEKHIEEFQGVLVLIMFWPGRYTVLHP